METQKSSHSDPSELKTAQKEDKIKHALQNDQKRDKRSKLNRN